MVLIRIIFLYKEGHLSLKSLRLIFQTYKIDIDKKFIIQKYKLTDYIPTKHLCILVPAKLWYFIFKTFRSGAENVYLVLFRTNLHHIWCKSSITNEKIYAGTVPSYGAI